MGTIKVKYALQPFYKMYFTHIYKGAQSCVRKYYFEKDKKKSRLATLNLKYKDVHWVQDEVIVLMQIKSKH